MHSHERLVLFSGHFLATLPNVAAVPLISVLISALFYLLFLLPLF